MKGSSGCLVLMRNYLMHCSAPRAPSPRSGARLQSLEQRASSRGGWGGETGWKNQAQKASSAFEQSF